MAYGFRRERSWRAAADRGADREYVNYGKTAAWRFTRAFLLVDDVDEKPCVGELAMINAIRIELLPGHSTGDAFFMTGSAMTRQGTVDTDLEPGIYRLTANKAAKKWVINGARPGLRFYVDLDGADPWALNYAAGLRLEVIGKRQILDPNEDLLDGIGPNAYRNDPKYVDRVTAGHYDVATGKFTVDHEDGSTVELDYDAILKHIQRPNTGGATMYVHYRNRQNNKIYPRLFDKSTAPNIVSMVLETEQARPSAEGLARLGRFLLELVKVRGSASAVGQTANKLPAQAAEATWKVVPRASARVVRQMAGITGNPPAARLRLASGDLLTADVLVDRTEVVYRVAEIIAYFGEKGSIRAAHRAMLTAAAEEARRLGYRTFKLLGKQANPNFRKHANKLAREVGVPNSGTEVTKGIPGAMFGDYEVTLRVDRVLSTNLQ